MLSDLDLLSDDLEIVVVTTVEDAAPAPNLVASPPEPEPAPDAEPPPPAPAPQIEVEAPPLALPPPPPDGPRSILASQILVDRPDVLNAYFVEHIRHTKGHADWVRQIGGSDSAEGYARYWYERNGRFEGYNQGQITAGDNIDLGRLLAERPDVLHAYQRDYLDHKGWKSHEWREILGGSSAEDYAKYWFRNHGQHEGYNQRPPAPAAPEVVEGQVDTAAPAVSPSAGSPSEATLAPTETPPVDQPPTILTAEPLPEEPQEQGGPSPLSIPPDTVEFEPDLEVEPQPEPPAQEEVVALVGAPLEDLILV